jgi:hypothetical protein
MAWRCRQHGADCKSYVPGGIKSLEANGVTLENVSLKFKEGKVDVEDLIFIIKCLVWIE